MKIRSSVFVFLMCFLFHTQGFSQVYQWRVGISTGYSNHYSHLSSYRLEHFTDIREGFRPSFPLVPKSNWTLSFEKNLTAGLGLSIHGGRQEVSANSHQGSALHPLRYQSNLWNIGSSFIFRMDNGKILPETSLLAPYVLVGAGWHTWESQTFNPAFQDPLQGYPGAAEGVVIGKNHFGNRYYLDMGMGIKLRLSQQFELFIQSNAQTNGTNLFRSPRTFLPLTSIDHQPIQPDTKREWLFQHQLGIKFSFAPKRTNFKASVISPSVETYQGEVKSEVVTNGLAPSMSDSLQGRSAPEDEIPRSMDVPESTESYDIFQRNIESGTDIMPFDSMESQYFQPAQMPYYPEPYGWNIEPEQGSTLQSFYQVYPVYPYSYTDYREYSESYPKTGSEIQQPHRTRYSRSERYPTTGQNRSYKELFVPIIVPRDPRHAARRTDTGSAESDPFRPLMLPASPDSLSIKPGFRLNPKVPLWSTAAPELKQPAPDIVIQHNTKDPNPSEPDLPVIYVEIYFEINESELSEVALSKLGEIAQTLKRFPDATVTLKGYADNTGSVTFNLNLIEKRTLSVAQALAGLFSIANDRIQLQDGAQLVRTRTPAARPGDRKVEVQILFLNSGLD